MTHLPGSLKGSLLSRCRSPCRHLVTVLRLWHMEWSRLGCRALTMGCVCDSCAFAQLFSESFRAQHYHWWLWWQLLNRLVPNTAAGPLQLLERETLTHVNRLTGSTCRSPWPRMSLWYRSTLLPLVLPAEHWQEALGVSLVCSRWNLRIGLVWVESQLPFLTSTYGNSFSFPSRPSETFAIICYPSHRSCLQEAPNYKLSWGEWGRPNLPCGCSKGHQQCQRRHASMITSDYVNCGLTCSSGLVKIWTAPEQLYSCTLFALQLDFRRMCFLLTNKQKKRCNQPAARLQSACLPQAGIQRTSGPCSAK